MTRCETQKSLDPAAVLVSRGLKPIVTACGREGEKGKGATDSLGDCLSSLASSRLLAQSSRTTM
eukprot:2891353-Rhodomonas_salina.1